MTTGPPPTTFEVSEAGARVDVTLCRHLGIGRRAARALVDGGLVTVDGKRARRGMRLSVGARVAVGARLVDAETTAVEDPRPRIVWSRAGVLGIAKPPGVHSVRGKGVPSVADYLAAHIPGIESVGASPAECGLVHRLDRDTSGILLAARDGETYRQLRAAFAHGRVFKEYLALVHGVVARGFEVDLPLARVRDGVRPARPGEPSWPAKTRVEPLEQGTNWTLVRASMTTGVTHQIRAHMALSGHPLLGDSKYGASADSAAGPERGHRLHAFTIRVGRDLVLAAPPGRAFLATLARLRGLFSQPGHALQ
jgi:23S rRNA pseudouridine1911/1915/1917 synthase